MAGESGAEDRQRQFLQAHMPRFEKPPTTPADRDRGFLAYWGNPTANFYSNVPPPHEDLVRDAAIRTPAGEDVPLLIGVWGLRPMGPAALWLTKPLFKMTVRSPTIDRGERPLLF